jgi:hypothetical protein
MTLTPDDLPCELIIKLLVVSEIVVNRPNIYKNQKAIAHAARAL